MHQAKKEYKICVPFWIYFLVLFYIQVSKMHKIYRSFSVV